MVIKADDIAKRAKDLTGMLSETDKMSLSVLAKKHELDENPETAWATAILSIAAGELTHDSPERPARKPNKDELIMLAEQVLASPVMYRQAKDYITTACGFSR